MDEHRRIVRCRRCQLRQYETVNRKCRRCHEPLYWIWTGPPPRIEPPPMPLPKPQPTWGKMLKKIRHDCGLSQKQLGNKSGMQRTMISKLEHRPKPPTMATAIRLAGALDVPNYVLSNVKIAYDYYCTRLLCADPLIETISRYFNRLSPEQRVIIFDTVRDLSEHRQMPFTEWEQIPPAALEGQCSGRVG